jgi:hypothetical protein
VAVEDVAKTAIITPFGLFEFTRMPFGLRNAGMTFQRLMDSVLGGLPFAFVYLEDILVASPDLSSHRQHLEAVRTVLQSNGLVVNADKCLFGCPEVDFLGHRRRESARYPPGFRPLPIFRRQPPSSTCRLSWASSIFAGISFQQRHGSSNP